MTETSYFWNGLVTGDATLAPYISNLWHSLWKKMFTRADNEGVLDNVDNELVVSGTSISVNVASGKALVDGTLYENDAPVNVVIPTPTTNPRIDRIVVQKNWPTKTIRIARSPGTENVTPTIPVLNQVPNSIWEIPLAEITITTAGVISVVNNRENARTRLALKSVGMVEIETLVSDGTTAIFDFQNIPSTYRHLKLVGNVLTNFVPAGIVQADINFNGDNTEASYNRIAFDNFGGVASAGSIVADVPPLYTIGDDALDAKHNTQFSMDIPNYAAETFYKTCFKKEGRQIDSTDTAKLAIASEQFIWLNTDVINRISFTPISSGFFQLGSKITLYGID